MLSRTRLGFVRSGSDTVGHAMNLEDLFPEVKRCDKRICITATCSALCALTTELQVHPINSCTRLATSAVWFPGRIHSSATDSSEYQSMPSKEVVFHRRAAADEILRNTLVPEVHQSLAAGTF